MLPPTPLVGNLVWFGFLSLDHALSYMAFDEMDLYALRTSYHRDRNAPFREFNLFHLPERGTDLFYRHLPGNRQGHRRRAT